MSIRAGYFGATFKDAVSDSAPPDPFTPSRANGTYLIYSDVDIHLSTNGDATTDNMPVPAKTMIEVSLYLGDTLSYIVGTGASDGSIWITQSN